jgi:orotate phosphoribosyltransferase
MDDILEMFRRSGALLNGHFQLTSGLHSPAYFQCAKVLQYPQFSESLAARIVDHFAAKQFDVVISPAIGGIVVGQEVGRQINVRTIFSERKDNEMQLRRGFEIGKGERVLICEDVVTTGGSVFEVIDLVKAKGAEIAGVGFIVDRSNGNADFGVDQFAVIQLNAETYPAESCPLCADGIPIEKPGSRKS